MGMSSSRTYSEADMVKACLVLYELYGVTIGA